MFFFGPLWIHVPKKVPLGCVPITNRCTTNLCKLEHQHIKWAFGVHLNGQ